MIAWQGSIAGQPIVVTMDKRPFPRSYWVIPGQLCAGFFPGDRNKASMEHKLEGLLDCGIQHIINLMEPDEYDQNGLPFVDYADVYRRMAHARNISATVVRFPIRDVSIPSRETMQAILDDIDHAIGRNSPVYVHCWGGKGRTGTVVGCYLIRHQLADANTVLSMIETLRCHDERANEPSPETGEQRRMVMSWREKK